MAGFDMKKSPFLIALMFLCTFFIPSIGHLSTFAGPSSIPVPFAVQLPEGKRFGYIDSTTQKWAIPPKYLEAHSFAISSVQGNNSQLAWVKFPNGGYTLINTQGIPQTPVFPFEAVGTPSEGLASYQLDGKWGYLSTQDGSFVIQATFVQVHPFKEGVASIQMPSGRWRYINKEGNRVGPRDYGYTFSYENKRAVALEDKSMYGVINERGDWLLKPNFGAILLPPPGEKNYLVGKVDKGKLSFIPFYEIVDSKGFAINKMKFQEVKNFSPAGYGAPVKVNDKWGIISSEAKWLIEPQFEDIQSVPTGTPVTAVKKDGLWGVLNITNSGISDHWYVKPTWKNEPDLSLMNLGRKQASPYEKVDGYYPLLIRVDQYFYTGQGDKQDSYINSMLDGQKALRQKNVTLAKESFQKALTFEPEDQAARYGLTQTLK
jgi:hypothetical protein